MRLAHGSAAGGDVKSLILVVAAGVTAITIGTCWSERRGAGRRSALTERAAQQRRAADSASRASRAAEAAADTVRRIVLRGVPRVREVIRRDTVPYVAQPGMLVISRATLFQADTVLGRADELARASSLAAALSESRAAALERLAATNRALYLNEKRRARFSRGTQFGVGGCVGAAAPQLTPCAYIGYGFQLKIP